jgi:hypothetical protein
MYSSLMYSHHSDDWIIFMGLTHVQSLHSFQFTCESLHLSCALCCHEDGSGIEECDGE